MCGRYASSSSAEDLVDEYEVVENLVRTPLHPNYNVAPTTQVPVVLERPDRVTSEGLHVPGARQLRTLRWGLVPGWAEDVSVGARMVNARSESAATKPAFRRAFSARRCLVPADGYYEWQDLSRDGAGTAGAKVPKQPWFVRPADGSPLTMAGLFEIWRDPALPSDHPDPFVWTCTVLTTQATPDLAHVHDRMPLTVPDDLRDAWLDPALTDVDEVVALVRPAGAGTMTAHPVARTVNSVRNNGPDLLAPLPVENGRAAVPGEQLSLLEEDL
ncbi:SOS response-associated peptidase [Nocardioides yefusunii]|uniref:Abasic site processing protein n=1 Tax=Nocardioides yefusunii TaxID=2500546 RepID=A0ABW1QZL0_9ACTN|nr:SOS response-associated peptidase [Nocardioides yefusunii]